MRRIFNLQTRVETVDNDFVAPPPPPTTAADIKNEAARRINAAYPAWKQMNVMREGGEALVAMSAFIDVVRAASNALEQSLPADFADDRHWLAG